MDSLPFDIICAQFFHEANFTRYCYFLSASLVCYEFLLQIGNEVELFWGHPWKAPKVLFLWSRYFTLAFNVCNAYVFMHENPSEDFCAGFFHWQNSGATLQYITTQAIMAVRLYAMYNQSKKIMWFLILLASSEIASMGVLFGIPQPGLIGTNQPHPHIFMCADADPPSRHWMAYIPAIILITESVFLMLALWKWIEYKRKRWSSDIVPWLVGQSIWYFAVIFVVHLVNLIMWLRNRITLNESITAISFAIPSILAQRLLIAVRQRPLPLPTQASTTQINGIESSVVLDTTWEDEALPMESIPRNVGRPMGSARLCSDDS